MKVRKTNAMRGPNYWSITQHQLIVMVLELNGIEDKPIEEPKKFIANLEKLFPDWSKFQHQNQGKKDYYKEENHLSVLFPQIALQLQILAGMKVSYFTAEAYGEEGVYSVVFSYEEEPVGIYAGKTALKICRALLAQKKYTLDKDIKEMRELRNRVRLGPSTGAIVAEAVSRGIPWLRLNQSSLCQLGYGANQKKIRATITSDTSSLAVDIACHKEETKLLLKEAQVPVSMGEIIYDVEGLKELVKRLGFPLVAKPVNGNHGRGITVNINSQKEALQAFKVAQEISSEVIIEKLIEGNDYRLLVIDHKFVAAALRCPAKIKGDGLKSVAELIDELNRDPKRGYGHENVLTQVSIDELTLNLIKSKGFTLETVLEKGKELVLKDTANLSTGGTAKDVTEYVHPANVFLAERISRIIGLDICGIDVMAKDIRIPVSEGNGAVIEVNAGPGFRMHLSPTTGLPRNVAAPVIDKLFPPGSIATIPIIAVTGSNGKTTTTRLIAHIAKQQGHNVGYTTSDGVYIQNRMLMKGDCTGPVSTRFVLRDPAVNFAVLECARGGILREGLGFPSCDIGIVTNVTEDHLGLNGIHTLEQLARIKAVIPGTVSRDGYSILNADDDLVYEMRKNSISKVALFSMDENNPRIRELQQEGGLCAVYENKYITICKGEWKLRVIKAANVPITFDGKAEFMIQNVLPAVLSAHIRGVSLEDIKAALVSFMPSPSQTPGRMNLYQFKEFKLLVDYAHNPSGMRALKKFTDKTEARWKVGVITGVGDRKNEDMVEVGKIAAQMFDEIIIRQDKHLRGRTAEDIINLLQLGISLEDPHKNVKVIRDEKEAVSFAIQNARPGSLIVICTEMVLEVTSLVKELQEKGKRPKKPNQKPIGRKKMRFSTEISDSGE